MALEKEQAAYARELARLLADEGKFVLIHGDEVVDVFGTYEDAIRTGYREFGLEPFLVKQISALEKVQYFSRAISPCPT